MPRQTYEYKGYLGSVEYSQDDKCWYGKLLQIVDLVTYEASRHEDLERSFHDSVDDYIATIDELQNQLRY